MNRRMAGDDQALDALSRPAEVGRDEAADTVGYPLAGRSTST